MYVLNIPLVQIYMEVKTFDIKIYFVSTQIYYFFSYTYSCVVN